MDVDIRSVIAELKRVGRHHQVASLVSNQQNRRIIFSGNAFHAIDPHTGALNVMSGLTKPLRRTYWPNTNMSNILRTPMTASSSQSSTIGSAKHRKSHFKKQVQRKERKTQKKKGVKKPKSVNAGKGRFFGSVQGTQVHQEMEDFLLLDERSFNKKYENGMHPWTKRILEYVVVQQNWYPIQCEFKVGDLAKRLATAVDIVCVDPSTGHLVFIELKTGGTDYFENNDGYMSGCLSFMRNSPLNWANVQLTGSVHLLLHQNPQLSLTHTSSHVLRIDEANLWAYPLDNGFIRRMTPCLLDELDMTAPKQKKQKKAKKGKRKTTRKKTK